MKRFETVHSGQVYVHGNSQGQRAEANEIAA